MNETALRALAQEYGFAEAALCCADAFIAERNTVEKQAELAERKQLRFDPREEIPWVKSLAVLLWAYDAAPRPGEGAVFVDSYYFASNAAYHASRKLEESLVAAGCRAKANVPYPARKAALRARLGIAGKNSMLITPRFGSRVVIVLLATDIEPEKEECGAPFSAQCLSCGRCIKACPGGALTEDGLTHPEKCLRNFMLEGTVVPPEIRSAMGMTLVGCDVCQRVCPMQPAGCSQAEEQPFRLSEYMTLDSAAFSQSAARLAERIGRNAARPQRIRAQAAMLAGNSGNAEYLPVLRLWAESEFPAVREHARWAIEQIERDSKSGGSRT